MRDILIRLREDAGQLTLAVLIQEREAAAWEIERLRGQLRQRGAAEGRRNQSAPQCLLRARIRQWNDVLFTPMPCCV